MSFRTSEASTGRSSSAHSGDLRRQLIQFGIGALAGSVPFWIVGSTRRRLPAPFDQLPLTALCFVVPATTALLVSAKAGELRPLRQAARPRRISWVWWWAAAAVMSVPIVIDALARPGIWTQPRPLAVVGMSLAYAVAALGEELGWTTFAAPRLLEVTRSVPATAAISSGYWILWHLTPFLQTGHDAQWVAGQCAQVILMRTAIISLSALAHDWCALAVVVHAASNIAWTLVPSGYRPWAADVLTLPGAVALLLIAIHPKADARPATRP